MLMTWPLYTSLSVLTAAVVIGNGYGMANPGSRLVNVVHHIFSSRFNVLIMLNLAMSLLFVFGKFLQLVFFGKLRDVEAKNVYDRLLHYILFKIVFLGAILDHGSELLVYICCFSILGFMKIFSMLARDRFEYITTFNPNTSLKTHARLLTLLVGITLFDIAWFYFCISAFKEAGAGRVLLITFECFTLFLDTIQTLIKYVIHIIDVSREGVWEQRGTYIYYTEFFTDVLILVATIGHYVQILAWHGFQPTLIDLVLFLHLRVVYNNLRDKITSYRNYRKLVQNMKDRYPDISGEELASLDDVCAICHDQMQVAKKLPCGHIFHHSCLRSWLEHHYNCPTCRYSLIDTSAGPAGPAHPGQANDVNHGRPDAHQGPAFGQERQRNEIFHFHGPRWLNWLPSIQVVSERRPMAFPHHPHHNVAVPQDMIQQVLEVFPHIPAEVIAEDLMRTRSVDLTTENILEGRVIIPPQPQPPQRAPQPPQPEPIRNVPSAASVSASPSPSPSPSNSGSVPSNIATSSIDAPAANFADVFANSSQERQNRFAQRKQAMLEAARRQFLEKQAQPEPARGGDSSTPSEDATSRKESKEEVAATPQEPTEEESLEQRRQRFLEAAQKRQQGTSQSEKKTV
eukprot:TRINITY_DN3566_c0_g1_i2.p1 TRINITY_DN3566_c0_g1~~TRINITY_DN3566_c0_g1_i2.p1  ORF type:complete len:627 (+),score=161.01 TRINITY_DN3566_c0_g1_i2:232-2112(+)